MQTLKKHFGFHNKDIGIGLLLAGGLLLVAGKLFLCSAQYVLLSPGAWLDDMVMYDGAVSITQGNWLGEYNNLTLSKHSFFALWLAVLHWLGIPFLLGGQLLWVVAAAATAVAVMPVLRRRWLGLALFAVLWLSPATTANPSPMGFTLRVYRDNIFPALCLLCVAGLLGFALRLENPLRKTWWWPVLAGLAFAACWLCREDGWWIAIFVVAAMLVAGVWLWRKTSLNVGQRLQRSLALLLPVVVLAGGLLAWCGMNQAVYGRFIISDFTSGEFADAYGALTRIKHENWKPKAAVPVDVRQKLYAHVPAFAELEQYLESTAYLSGYAPDDYSSGSFYWALRQAVGELGYYDTPEKAKEYFEGLARDINALCAEGVLEAGPKRSSVSPPIRAEYVGPVAAEWVRSLWFCATFQQCDARAMFSNGANDEIFYWQRLRPMEEFLGEKALRITKENSEEPYFNRMERVQYLALDVIRWVYTVATPCALLAALAWQVWVAVGWARRGQNAPGGREKQKADPGEVLVWLVQLGVLCTALLRAAMVAFVTVSSFYIGTYVMYLSSVHPLLLLFAFVGSLLFVRRWLAKREEKKGLANGR